MALPTHYTLNNGVSVPAVGLGTFQSADGNSKVKDAVLSALKTGYRMIDGANAYGNEKEIGEAIRESGIPREEIFIISKLAQTWHEPDDVERGLDMSLRDLQLGYVDLYLMHFPHAYKAGENNKTIRHPSGNGKPVIDYDLSRRYTDTWAAMEKLVESGKARAIGISNFNILKTKRLVENAKIIPAVNQVELHPYLPQHDLLEFSSRHGILLMAHQPLGGRPVGVVRAYPDHIMPTEDPTIMSIASQLNMTSSQVCLAWALQRGTPVVPKSNTPSHQLENLSVSNLPKLPDDVFQTLQGLAVAVAAKAGGDAIKDKGIRFLNPSKHLGFDIFDEEEDQPVGDHAPWDT